MPQCHDQIGLGGGKANEHKKKEEEWSSAHTLWEIKS